MDDIHRTADTAESIRKLIGWAVTAIVALGGIVFWGIYNDISELKDRDRERGLRAVEVAAQVKSLEAQQASTTGLLNQLVQAQNTVLLQLTEIRTKGASTEEIVKAMQTELANIRNYLNNIALNDSKKQVLEEYDSVLTPRGIKR